MVRICPLFFIVIIIALFVQQLNGPEMQAWHTEQLSEEFSTENAEKIKTFTDYLQLEDKLFKQLNDRIYNHKQAGNKQGFGRYRTSSATAFYHKTTDWNRSFELTSNKPRAAVLLLHGMSDSPYSLRAIGQALQQQNFYVLGLRLPGHGTIPAGLRTVTRYDMAAATRLAMKHLAEKVAGKPVYIIGYSTGATLALEYTLDAQEGKTGPIPAKLVLISPAIAIHPLAALARFKNALSLLPGLDNLAYLQVQAEFDPYKYNSFATNAGDVVYRLTRSVTRRIRDRAAMDVDWVLPPMLIFKSTVDATVTNTAVLDNLLAHLKPNRHELVLFDINRFAVVRDKLLIADPAPFTDRLRQENSLPFTTVIVANKNTQTTQVVSKTHSPFSNQVTGNKVLGISWPPGVVSLSHVPACLIAGSPVWSTPCKQ